MERQDANISRVSEEQKQEWLPIRSLHGLGELSLNHISCIEKRERESTIYI
jgi:hypothetical protein